MFFSTTLVAPWGGMYRVFFSFLQRKHFYSAWKKIIRQSKYNDGYRTIIIISTFQGIFNF